MSHLFHNIINCKHTLVIQAKPLSQKLFHGLINAASISKSKHGKELGWNVMNQIRHHESVFFSPCLLCLPSFLFSTFTLLNSNLLLSLCRCYGNISVPRALIGCQGILASSHVQMREDDSQHSCVCAYDVITWRCPAFRRLQSYFILFSFVWKIKLLLFWLREWKCSFCCCSHADLHCDEHLHV